VIISLIWCKLEEEYLLGGSIVKVKKFLGSLLLTVSLVLFTKGLFIFAQEEKSQYEISGKFNESNKTFIVTENVRFKNNYKEGLQEVAFHLYPDSYNKIETMPAFSMGLMDGEKIVLKEEQKGDIDIKSVNVSNRAVSFTQDNQILKLKLDKGYKLGEEILVTIEFELKVPMGNSRFGYYDDVYSLTNWYPILSIYDAEADRWDENPYHPIGESNYSEVADYNLKLELPSNMVVASTGINLKEEVKGSIKKLEVSAENVRDFVFIMSPRFKVISKEVLGVKVNNFYLDLEGISAERSAKEILDITCDAVEFFSNKFGKYPYEELDIVESFLVGGAMEYPQLIQMPTYNRFSQDVYNGGRVSFTHEAAVHEAAHQWWYVVVGNNEYKEPFLDESLTVFSTAYFFENKYGKYAPNGVYMTIRNNVFPGKRDMKPINLPVDKFNDISEYFMTIYSRGSIVFEDLRQRVGEETFLKIIQSYFESYKFKNATVKGFIETIEAEAGEGNAKAIEEGMNAENYYPKNIELSNEERQAIYAFQAKLRIEEAEKRNGVILGSIPLRAMKGEKIYLVKPSNLTEGISQLVDDSVRVIKESMKLQYGSEIVIKTDKEITEDEKKEGNFILLGGLDNNQVLRDINGKIPVLLTKRGVLFDGMLIINKDISGCFSAKNPYNKDKVITTYYWSEGSNLPEVFYGIYETTEQFIFKIGSKKEIRGMFEQ
jgi:hypothetical protein